MSDTDISKFVVSYGGKNADVDIIYRDGQKFYNATKLWQTFSGKETERVYDFLRLDDTKKFLFQKYSELTDHAENTNEINDLTNSSDGRVSIPQDIGVYLTKTHKQSLPNEILEPFVYTKRGMGGGTYLSEPIFIEYAMKLSAQLKSVVIEVFRKYGWLEMLPQGKKVDALLEMTFQEEMKNISEQYPSRDVEKTYPKQIQSVEKTSTKTEDEAFTKARSEASDIVRSTARLQGKLSTKLMQQLLSQIIKNEGRVFASVEEEQYYLRDYYINLFETMYLALFNHRAQEMRDLIEQESGTPRDSLTATCLLAVQRAEANIATELLGLGQIKRSLTISALKEVVVQCCQQPAADLFKYSKEIDFLVADKKIKETRQIKKFDVTLDDSYQTQVKTHLIDLPKKEKVKRIANKQTKALSSQPNLFGDSDV